MFLRCAPALRRARTVLREGVLGELLHADASFGHPGLTEGMFTGHAAWMLDPERGGSGAFADLGVHLVDLLCWMRPDAGVAVRGAQLRARPGLAVDVGGVALVDWGGVPVTLRTSWIARPGGVRLHLEGSCGSVTVHNGELRLRTGDTQRAEAYDPPSARDVLPAFLSALRGEDGAWDAPTATDVINCAEILEAAVRSAAVRGEGPDAAR
ncbi:Gfo/Idh/MocA family protein [Streptomyces sp. NPDC059373]